jgi:hypothetical protein
MISFLQNSIPLSQTNYAERRRRINENIEASKQAFLDAKEGEKYEQQLEREYNESKMAEKLTNGKKANKMRKISEELQNNYEMMEDLLVESFTEFFINSIPIDDEIKGKFYEGIKENGRQMIKGMFDAELINMKSFSENNSSLVRKVYDLADKYIAESKETGELNKFSFMIEAEDISGGHISNTVMKKVADTVKKEKDIAEKNKEDLDKLTQEGYSFMKKEKPSLFRSIMINNSRQPITEDGKKSEELNMDMVMCESVIMYSLLEFLNTTYLLNLNAKQIQSLAFSFSFNG